MSNSPLVVGAHLLVLVNGRRFAECTSFDFSHSVAIDETGGIDATSPYELGVGQVRFTASMSYLRRQNSGGALGRGLLAPYSQASDTSYWSLLILNRRDRSILFRADRCISTGLSERVAARDRMVGSVSFTGMSWSNEVEAFANLAREFASSGSAVANPFV